MTTHIVEYREGNSSYDAGPFASREEAERKRERIARIAGVTDCVAVSYEGQRCQAEDMGGWPACVRPATLQTKEEPRRYYCAFHKTNRHVWREDELEPMITPEMKQATSLLMRMTDEQRGLVLCWFCNYCRRCVEPGDFCTCMRDE